MSDAVVIGIVTAVCTALPLILAQVIGIIKATRRMDEGLKQVNENIAVVQASAEESKADAKVAKEATVKLQEGQNFMAASLQTNTLDTNAIKEAMASYIEANSKPAPLA